MRRGPLTAGEKVQFTDRRSNKITDQLVPGGVTQTSHGIILHDDVIGQSEGSVVVTVSAKREAQINQDHPERDANKPWKGTRQGFVFFGVLHYFKHTGIFSLRELAYFIDGCGADAPCRCIYYSGKAQIVAGVCDNAEVGEHIFYFRTFKKACSSVYLIRYTVALEGKFYTAGKGVYPV